MPKANPDGALYLVKYTWSSKEDGLSYHRLTLKEVKFLRTLLSHLEVSGQLIEWDVSILIPTVGLRTLVDHLIGPAGANIAPPAGAWTTTACASLGGAAARCALHAKDCNALHCLHLIAPAAFADKGPHMNLCWTVFGPPEVWKK